MPSRSFILGSGVALALVVIGGSTVTATAPPGVAGARPKIPILVSPVQPPGRMQGEVVEDDARITTAVRTQGEVMEDARITTAVTSRLMWNKHTNNLTTNVYTNRGKVTLRGIADSAAARDHASSLALDTRGVLQVDNQLLVMAGKAAAIEATESSMRAVGQDIADRWITTKVKSTLLYSSTVHGASILVNTRSGVVTLTGKADFGTEHALAMDLVSNVRGVKRVQLGGDMPLASLTRRRMPPAGTYGLQQIVATSRDNWATSGEHCSRQITGSPIRAAY